MSQEIVVQQPAPAQHQPYLETPAGPATGLHLTLTRDFTIAAVSDAYLQAIMIGRDDIIGRRIFDVLPGRPSATALRDLSVSLQRVLRSKTSDAMAVQRITIRRPDSNGGGLEEHYWRMHNSPILRPDGQVDCIILQIKDVTDSMHRKREQEEHEQDNAAEDLRRRNGQMEAEILHRTHEAVAITRKLEAEQNLHQTQKMEAVGQLTGGIAHDFNNILTVIFGATGLLAEATADQPKLVALTKMIDDAAQHAADLTQHLLSFARKQPLQPRHTDINALIAGMVKLLRPSLAEHIDIELVFEAEAWPALIDPGQLTTALLNLAVNARDAMPDGGKLIIETGNVYLDEAYAAINGDIHPGHYVMIAVSDTGSGMSAAIRERAFEPFFTTKEVGKGTGLGLSMVYGFVKQSDGHIKIYSEEGHGTSVKLYLPRTTGSPEVTLSVMPTALVGGNESILVVEDDPLLRRYVNEQLLSLGYRTTIAANSVEALAFLDRDLACDLLFTDVILSGGTNGRELADAVRTRRATIKVLFTSGYTESAIMHNGRLEPGVLLLPKPYRKSDLAHMVRVALGSA
jgi:signal transduction histidine kinase